MPSRRLPQRLIRRRSAGGGRRAHAAAGSSSSAPSSAASGWAPARPVRRPPCGSRSRCESRTGPSPRTCALGCSIPWKGTPRRSIRPGRAAAERASRPGGGERCGGCPCGGGRPAGGRPRAGPGARARRPGRLRRRALPRDREPAGAGRRPDARLRGEPAPARPGRGNRPGTSPWPTRPTGRSPRAASSHCSGWATCIRGRSRSSPTGCGRGCGPATWRRRRRTSRCSRAGPPPRW